MIPPPFYFVCVVCFPLHIHVYIYLYKGALSLVVVCGLINTAVKVKRVYNSRIIFRLVEKGKDLSCFSSKSREGPILEDGFGIQQPYTAVM